MKIKDILKYENCNKVYTRQKDGMRIEICDYGNVYINNKKTCLNIEDEFIMLTNPVDFMTAYNAWENGKTIFCQKDGCGYKEYPPHSMRTFNIREILSYEWYIKESENKKR